MYGKQKRPFHISTYNKMGFSRFTKKIKKELFCTQTIFLTVGRISRSRFPTELVSAMLIDEQSCPRHMFSVKNDFSVTE